MDSAPTTRDRLLATVGGLERFAQSFHNRTFRANRHESELAGAEATAAERLVVISMRAEDRPDMIPELQEEWLAGYVKRWGAYQNAGARTANSMITGPARFPVARNEKRQAIEAKRRDELLQWIENAGSNAERRVRARLAIDLGPAGIVQRDLDDLRANLAERQARQETMKAENRAKPRTHPHFSLTNNNAEIRRLIGRVHDMERRLSDMAAAAEKPPEPAKVIGGVSIIENAAIDRLQLKFPGKPDAETIRRLKGTGWRWSPSHGAWQRQLTNAARHAVAYVLQVAA